MLMATWMVHLRVCDFFLDRLNEKAGDAVIAVFSGFLRFQSWPLQDCYRFLIIS